MAKAGRLEDIKASIERLIDSYDARGIIGPIGYLEEAIENIESAMEEMDHYGDGG